MKKIFKENAFFCIFFFIMSIYYLYRLFAITPWYDELYTYLTFIDKGFFYSLTHWPLPNNHILFSALSSLLRPAGAYFSLRGLSYLSALGTLILLYSFIKNIYGKAIATLGSVFYTMLLSVNTLAVQGRGYSFATFCFILALYCVQNIIQNQKPKRFYILFTLSLYFGLYTLVSSIYWVMAVCICGGLVLLIHTRYRDFIKLVLYSLAAAFLTLLSYSVVWLAIGSNFLIDTVAEYHSENHVGMILQMPLKCWTTGITLMVNNPYMQGLDNKSVFLQDFKYFGRDILFSFFNIRSLILFYTFVVITLVLSIIFFICTFYYKKKKQNGNALTLFAVALSGLSFYIVFIVLFIQCAYPYDRVFSFLGILFTIMFCTFFTYIWKLIKKKFYHSHAKYIVNLGAIIFCIIVLLSPSYNKEYSYLDYYAYDAISHVEWNGINTYFANDIYAQQQIRYHCTKDKHFPLTEDSTKPQIIVLKKDLQTEEWANLTFNNTLDERIVIYENDCYIVYQ